MVGLLSIYLFYGEKEAGFWRGLCVRGRCDLRFCYCDYRGLCKWVFCMYSAIFFIYSLSLDYRDLGLDSELVVRARRGSLRYAE